MSRIPLRLRLTFVFAVAMALVLAAVGTLLYVRLGDSLLAQIDERLVVLADEAAARALARDAGLPPPRDDDEFTQLLSANGQVLGSTPDLEASLIRADQLPPAGGQAFTEVEAIPPGEDEPEPARVLVVWKGRLLFLVGAWLDDREDALERLLAELLLAGPLALLLASTAGYVVAGAALRPVDAMRRRAAEISAETAGERLPLPEARDELRRLGETLNAMLDRLDAGLRRERRFVADAGHELRTPLALLRTELELALRRPRAPQELEAALRSAADEVDRLARLADDLLVLATTEEGAVPLRRAPFPVRDVVEGVVRRFAARAESAGRAIGIGAIAEGDVDADRVRLEQALGNLVDNALRHGGGAIRLDATRKDGRIVLAVHDDGPGFPADFLARAFERFSRGDAARTDGGPGLGLAIVDAIARAHGGEALARNVPGGGAEVAIAIPSAGTV